ncbi:MAG: chromate efflux transporter [Methyloceanibacter sp.]|uniref:chromate efflux transporter n=1 Tax=Methyloceanibacter sp. TaxID=1965321 RepID=UPI003D6CDFB6
MGTIHHSPEPTFREALSVWAKIGVTSFGGPAGQIALMHRVLVEERGWIGPERFLHALNFCMLLPGPEAMQLATYVGWRLHGTLGGLAAGLLFVLPGALVVLALSIAYALFGQVPLVEAAFVGIKAAVLVIVIEALLKVARRALHRGYDWAIAASAFFAIFFLDAPFPLIIAGAALAGFLLALIFPVPVPPPLSTPPVPVPLSQTVRTAALWLAIWILPLLTVSAWFGRDHVTTDIALFFSKLAVVTFGGAYSVLAYMAQQAVETYGWLSAGEMLDGLGLAETTPGPLILVTEFVGFLAGYRHGGEPQLAFGLLGAAVTLWATFAPCFLWIFVGAPYIERLASNAKLAGTLRGVTAAVVGVILNLSLWFALHVIFGRVEAEWHGPLRIWMPDFATFNVEAALLACLAAILLLGFRLGIVTTLTISAAAALAVSLAQSAG